MYSGLDGQLPVYAAAALFVVGHLVVFAYFVRRASVARRGAEVAAAEAATGSTTDPPEGLPAVDADETVRCPHCSVENEAGYRFCRFCVGELRGAEVVAEGESSPRSRGLF